MTTPGAEETLVHVPLLRREGGRNVGMHYNIITHFSFVQLCSSSRESCTRKEI